MNNCNALARRSRRAVFVLTLGLVGWTLVPVLGEEHGEDSLPTQRPFHLFLLVGQSNMAGRGKIDAEDCSAPPRVLTLDPEGRWVAAKDPLHFDGPNRGKGGVGLGRSFGMQWARHHPDATVGLIPCAVGGTAITQWVPGGVKTPHNVRPYDDAIARAQRAMKQGTLKGILWHQGEADCHDVKSALAYEANLTALIIQMRKDLGGGDIPFIIGQLGQFEKEPWSGWDSNRAIINAAHQKVSAETAQCGFVRSDGLTDKGDHLHFDAKSLREFGKRYFLVLMALSRERSFPQHDVSYSKWLPRE